MTDTASVPVEQTEQWVGDINYKISSVSSSFSRDSAIKSPKEILHKDDRAFGHICPEMQRKSLRYSNGLAKSFDGMAREKDDDFLHVTSSLSRAASEDLISESGPSKRKNDFFIFGDSKKNITNDKNGRESRIRPNPMILRSKSVDLNYSNTGKEDSLMEIFKNSLDSYERSNFRPLEVEYKPEIELLGGESANLQEFKNAMEQRSIDYEYEHNQAKHQQDEGKQAGSLPNNSTSQLKIDNLTPSIPQGPRTIGSLSSPKAKNTTNNKGQARVSIFERVYSDPHGESLRKQIELKKQDEKQNQSQFKARALPSRKAKTPSSDMMKNRISIFERSHNQESLKAQIQRTKEKKAQELAKLASARTVSDSPRADRGKNTQRSCAKRPTTTTGNNNGGTKIYNSSSSINDSNGNNNGGGGNSYSSSSSKQLPSRGRNRFAPVSRPSLMANAFASEAAASAPAENSGQRAQRVRSHSEPEPLLSKDHNSGGTVGRQNTTPFYATRQMSAGSAASSRNMLQSYTSTSSVLGSPDATASTKNNPQVGSFVPRISKKAQAIVRKPDENSNSAGDRLFSIGMDIKKRIESLKSETLKKYKLQETFKPRTNVGPSQLTVAERQRRLLQRQKDFENAKNEKIQLALRQKEDEAVAGATFKPDLGLSSLASSRHLAASAQQTASPALTSAPASCVGSDTQSGGYSTPSVSTPHREKEFTPQLVSRQIKSPSVNGEYDDVYQRLFYGGVKKKDQVLADARVYLEEQLKATIPFTPQLQAKVSNVVHRELSSNSAFERLTKTDVRKEMEQVLSKLKIELEDRECTFAPQIVPPPGGYNLETDDLGQVLPVADRLQVKHDRVRDKIAKQRERKAAELAKELTLRPKLPKSSSKMAERRLKSGGATNAGGETVFNRLSAVTTASLQLKQHHKVSKGMQSYFMDQRDQTLVGMDDDDEIFDFYNPLQEKERKSVAARRDSKSTQQAVHQSVRQSGMVSLSSSSSLLPSASSPLLPSQVIEPECPNEMSWTGSWSGSSSGSGSTFSSPNRHGSLSIKELTPLSMLMKSPKDAESKDTAEVLATSPSATVGVSETRVRSGLKPFPTFGK